MLELALATVRSHVAVPGVQPKVTVTIEAGKSTADPARFTIVGLWGEYILKPPARDFAHLPEVEDATMHLAQLAGLATVPHTLIRLQNGHLAYLTRRIDRLKTGYKLPMEDFCQLTGRLTEHKYRGTYEQIGKAIKAFSATPGLDIGYFCEQVLFSFLTGNADMHLKNFSLLTRPETGPVLAPAYDMVASALLVEDDPDDVALLLNNRKQELDRSDFTALFDHFGLPPKTQATIWRQFELAIPKWLAFMEISFLPTPLRLAYCKLILIRCGRLAIPLK